MSNKRNKNYYRYSMYPKYAAVCYILTRIMCTNFESVSHMLGGSLYKFVEVPDTPNTAMIPIIVRAARSLQIEI